MRVSASKVRADCDQRLLLVRGGDHVRPVDDAARRARELSKHTEELAVGQTSGEIGGDDLDTQRFRAGLDDGTSLREQVGIDHEPRRLALARASQQRHRLGCGGRLVEHRRVGSSMPVRSATIVWR